MSKACAPGADSRGAEPEADNEFKEMKAEIKKILFSRNECSVAMVQQMLDSKAIDSRELSAVLDSAIAESLMGELTRGVNATISQGGTYDGPDHSNLIFLWGARSSGKSSVIASLLTLPGMTPLLPKSADADNIKYRIKAMTNMFSRQDRYQRLLAMDNPLLEAYHARYKKGMRNYHLTLVEAGVENWVTANTLLSQNSRQVHLFLIDCRQDIDIQVAAHKQVTQLLISAGYLQQASGVYVVVTKADLMNAPAPYLENAVQTLVTTSMASDFWRMVRNKCKETHIYNEQPVVCSVGDFALTDYARLNNSHTQRLCDEFIIPKCEHLHWGLAWLLKLGSKKMAVAVAICALALLGALGYKFLNGLNTPPTQELAPYDYVSNFLSEVSADLSEGTDYASASDSYALLRIDLDAEHGIRLQDRSALLGDKDYNRCDSKLCNAFAGILTSKVEVFFESNDWSSDSAAMHKFTSQLGELKGHYRNMRADNVNQCKRYMNYLVCYRDSIKGVIKMCDNCKSLSDVQRVVGLAKRWADEYPYNNDSELKEALDEASYAAFSSCADYYYTQGDDLLDDYYDKKPFRIIYPSTVAQLESSIMKLKEQADELREEIIDSDDENYYEILEYLDEIISRLNNAID